MAQLCYYYKKTPAELRKLSFEDFCFMWDSLRFNRELEKKASERK